MRLVQKTKDKYVQTAVGFSTPLEKHVGRGGYTTWLFASRETDPLKFLKWIQTLKSCGGIEVLDSKKESDIRPCVICGDAQYEDIESYWVSGPCGFQN